MSSGSHSSFQSDEDSNEEEVKKEHSNSYVSSVLIADNRTEKNDFDDSIERN